MSMSAPPERLRLSERFTDAVAYAGLLHAEQWRKGTGVPYVAHLLGVASLVLEDGGSEDEAIAAMLHDAVEDQGGEPTLAEIRQRFGPRVADVVDECSDTDQVPKPPWEERKREYLAHLTSASPEALRVSLADKLHNARAILRDLRVHGDSVWDRFGAGPEEQLWYYGELARAFARLKPGPMADELTSVIRDLTELVVARRSRPDA